MDEEELKKNEKMTTENEKDVKLVVEAAPETEQSEVLQQETEQEDIEETEQDAEEKEEVPSLKDVIREQATEDEAPMSKNFTLRKILGGDILTSQAVRRQVWLFLLITLFVIIYISNRYSCQQNLIEIDQLQKNLTEAKYKALSSSSQLTEKCRESKVLETLQNNKDSVLKIPSQPPYIIQVPKEK